MAAIFEINQIQARKRALVAESEVYRQTLQLEARNLKLYGVATRQRFSRFRQYAPILTALTLLARGYITRKSKPTILGRLFSAWRLYLKFAPAIALFLGRGRAMQLASKPAYRRGSAQAP